MRIVLWIFIVIFVLAGGAVGGFLAMGPDRFWGLAGPADLGTVSFETLERRSSPNDALVCPDGLCAASRDVRPPVWAIEAALLAEAMDAAISAEFRLERVDDRSDPAVRRYVQRSEKLGYPDTVSIAFVDLPEGRSTLAMYSRSQIGKSDFGVNLDRVRRWLTLLEDTIEPESR